MTQGATPDRAWLLAQQDVQKTESNVLAQIEHYQAMGIGLAAFCVAMEAALQEEAAFSREESMRLVEAAVQGLR